MKTYTNNPKTLNNYYCYDDEINSPANSEVVKVIDKFQDSIIMDNNQADSLAKNLPGNYIIIKHADKEYYFLAHLKPHSVVVKEGEYIKRHQKIGHCGNTGNTTEPHLHFQVQTGISFIFSAGIPICFNDIIIESIPNYHLLDNRETKMPNNDSKESVQFINRGYMVANE